jgi:hypothetical protein
MHRSRTLLGLAATAATAGIITAVLAVPDSGPAESATRPTAAARLASAIGGGVPNGAAGDVALGNPGGAVATQPGSATWIAYESAASNLVLGDTNDATDVFVTNGASVRRLSVLPDGTQADAELNSWDPDMCASGRRVVFTTEVEFDEADTNGAEDVYVIDRDADGNGIFDEFSKPGGVSLTLVAASWDPELEEFVAGLNGSSGGVISADCSKVAFVSDSEFDENDFNFLSDVFLRDLDDLFAPVEWISRPAEEGGEGGGFLPAINRDGSRVVFTTEATDLVEADGIVGGIVVRDRPTDTTFYVTTTPVGEPSSALPDTEAAATISASGNCVAYKANLGFDLLPDNSGPAEGIFLWNAMGEFETTSLVSVRSNGTAAASASTPKLSADCRFVGYESADEFIVAEDANNNVDVFLYDTVTGGVSLISKNAQGVSAAGTSNISHVVSDPFTGRGSVLLTTSAPDIFGIDGGSSEIDLFRVGFVVVPASPGRPTATPANGSATVTWDAPLAAGIAIRSYTVTASPGGRTCASSGAARTCTVTGLTNGTPYTFTVRANSVRGAGADSQASVAVTPRTTPGAPTGVAGTAGNAQATVRWTAPANNGGAAVTGYSVTAAPGGRTCTTTGATSCAVTGLTNGTAYTFTVRAQNAAGLGTASTASAQVRPRTVPGAPRSVTATPGSRQVRLNWQAPASNGGANITAYRVQRSTNGTTWTTVTSTASASTRTFTVTGLTNGTQYQFRVAAINVAGAGVFSAIVRSTPR